MITPDEIRDKALKLYETFLISWLNGETFFPKEIPSNKGKSTDKYEELNRSISLLMNSSKNQTGKGYRIIFRSSDTRKHGSQSLPEKIVFETEDDFLLYINKKSEFQKFQDKTNDIIQTLPELSEWIKDNIKFVVANDNWDDILRVCIYFKQKPLPDMYIRELPIEVHTKFIENNIPILKSLLDYLLPENAVCKNESSFEKRYYLRYDEPTIRFRHSIDSVDLQCLGNINDLAIPISSFINITINCKNIFIIENKMTYLTFPTIVDSIVIWGKGFNVELLKNVKWLSDTVIYCWSDIDIHGFQILAQLRKYFPKTQSLMMDYETYMNFKEFAVEDPNFGKNMSLELTESEYKIYKIICSQKEKSRLEQERISQKYIIETLKQNNFIC